MNWEAAGDAEGWHHGWICCKVRFLGVEFKSGPKDFKGLQMPTSSKN